MTAVKRERLVIRRPKTLTEKTLARLAAHPKIRARFSSALRKPFFPKDIYISGPAGRYVHFRLMDQKKFHKGSFRTKEIGEHGTKMIVGCPAGQWNGSSCRVGMKAAAILVPKDRVKAVVRSVTHTSRFTSNPLLMTVTNPGPGYKKNPVDVEYEAGSKQYRVYRTNKGRSARRYRKNGMTIPLWNNPEFGKLEVESFRKNPMDIALQTMPILNDNPGYCENPGMCENPSHEHNLTPAELAGVDAYDENPCHTDNLTPAELAGVDAYDENPGGLPGYFGGVFGDNARRGSEIPVGTFVRNLKRVMKGNEIELDAKTLGTVESSGQFMGDTVYTVHFYLPDGSSKSLKFFKHELSVEPTQMGFDNNPFRHSPAHPRALQRHQRGSNGRTPKFGEVHALAKQPVSRPGPGQRTVKKVKVPLPKFEAWLKQNGSPDEKHRYNQAKAAYRRFHKGADPEFITRRVVDVGAGKKIVARSFAYSMGKSPFEPYITPKGSGKGPNKPYLHEYETMPEGVTVPGGKVVIKPLDGATKITDWIHR